LGRSELQRYHRMPPPPAPTRGTSRTQESRYAQSNKSQIRIDKNILETMVKPRQDIGIACGQSYSCDLRTHLSVVSRFYEHVSAPKLGDCTSNARIGQRESWPRKSKSKCQRRLERFSKPLTARQKEFPHIPADRDRRQH
jgi:hypothetical protein